MPSWNLVRRRIGDPSARFLLAASVVAVAASTTPVRSDDQRPDYRPAAFAIAGARIMARPGVTYDPGTVVVREGRIEAVGPADDVEVPYDAERIDGTGLVVYPGFIDGYTTLGAAPGTKRSATGPGRSIPFEEFALPSTPTDDRSGLTPEFEVASALDVGAKVVETRRSLGFTDALAAPGGSIAGGQSVLMSFSGRPRRAAVLRSPVGLHIQLQPPTEPGDARIPGDPSSVEFRRVGGYPVSLMGVIAHLRQAMYDAEYHQQLLEFAAERRDVRPPYDPALEALAAARSGALDVWWEAETRDEIHRVLDLAEEFGTRAVIVGGREAAKVAERLKERDVPVVLRVNFAEEPKVPDVEAYRKKPLNDRDEPLRVLEDRARRWRERVSTASELAKLGVRFAFTSDGLEKPDQFLKQVRLAIREGLSVEAAFDGLTRRAAEIIGAGTSLGTIEPGKLGHLVVWSAPIDAEDAKVRYVLIDGLKFDLKKDDEDKTRREEPEKADESGEPSKSAEEDVTSKPTEPPARPQAEAMKQESREVPFLDLASELDEDREPALRTGGEVLIRDVVILTASEAGTIPRGSILVRDGKIDAIGPDLDAPEGVAVIEAAGMVAMPGIIDTHSHMAIQGGVNEGSLSIVPEVRVADVVDSDDVTIHRAAAGGVTAARLLHGSANTIGGQDVVIKLKWGRPARELILRDEVRPQGVKFALGENVTRSRTRFPNTRMGVEAVLDRAFVAGREYGERRAEHEAALQRGETPPPFRRDLRLEAIAAVVDGSFKIHSHCYRADEILMLLRTAERHGIRVQSLQHVLEGYKVAPEIAAHGASASTFSDWWAYKVEAFDAIPYNAALLSEAGAQVCIKSDSEELVRHLYLEAAKMVKYGGVSEAQALKMITLNPARELGLDHRLGSIEVGKDADIALFNAHPFDGYARCELTLADGEVTFQREKRGSLTPRPGDHVRMPQPPPEELGRKVEIPANDQGLYALVGARLHPVSGPDVAEGTLVIADGRIAAIGGPDTPVPAGAVTVDLKGLDVWPGMIDAASQIGLFEVGSLTETRDFADAAQFQPELRTSVAIRADSELIPVTRVNGILSSFIMPTGGLISGRGSLINLAGWVPPEMVVDDLTALSVRIPTHVRINPESRRARGDDDPNRRRKPQLDEIRDKFRLAKEYARIVAEARNRGVDPPAFDPRLEALAPYARGEKPVAFQAETRVEILDAIEIAKDLGLKPIIVGGAEAWKVVESLRSADVPVVLTGTLRLPSTRTDPYDSPYSNPLRLRQAGVRFAIRSGAATDSVTTARNQPFEAAVAVAYGLPEADAVRSVTLSPAEILGVEDRLGSLEVGKRANLVITAGPLLQVSSAVKGILVEGRPIELESRHTRLYARYRRRLTEVRTGVARLGLDRGSNASDDALRSGGLLIREEGSQGSGR